MKRDTINYLVAGTVVLGALILLLAVLYRITGRTGAADDYHAQYQRVAGINYGTPVYYEGYRIGQVRAVRPIHDGSHTRFQVQLAVDQGWPIPADSVAQIASAGLLSDVFIYIHEGQADEALVPGSRIDSREAADLFSALGDLASEIQGLSQSDLQPLLSLVKERVDNITSDLERQAPQIVNHLQELMARLNDSASSVQELLGEHNRGSVERTLENLEAMSGNAARLTAELDASRAQLDQILAQLHGLVVDNRPEIQRTVRGLEMAVATVSQRLESISHNLDEASRNFNEFSRTIRRNPNRLLYTREPDDAETGQ